MSLFVFPFRSSVQSSPHPSVIYAYSITVSFDIPRLSVLCENHEHVRVQLMAMNGTEDFSFGLIQYLSKYDYPVEVSIDAMLYSTFI
jgi:hypothetical protein